MAQLHASLGMTDVMDEPDQPFPFALLRIVPEAKTAGRDTRFGRYAGHLGEDEARTAHRARAQMGNMEIVDQPSFAEYIAIGDTTIRLASDRPRTR